MITPSDQVVPSAAWLVTKLPSSATVLLYAANEVVSESWSNDANPVWIYSRPAYGKHKTSAKRRGSNTSPVLRVLVALTVWSFVYFTKVLLLGREFTSVQLLRLPRLAARQFAITGVNGATSQLEALAL